MASNPYYPYYRRPSLLMQVVRMIGRTVGITAGFGAVVWILMYWVAYLSWH